MSPPLSPSERGARPHAGGRLHNFWQRISEGRQLHELWAQFSADASASYGFYMKETDAEELEKYRGLRRWFKIAKSLFWAMVMMLSPARRILLLLSLLLLALSGVKTHGGNGDNGNLNFELLAALIFLLLLSLELADKVTMKRDLEIAREIQSWLVPSQPPVVSGADIAFATRPQNSVAGDYYDAFYPVLQDQSKLMVVIADVAGKSVPAALLMATLQASLRTIAGDGAPLAQLVARLNRYASAHSLDGLRFTTAVLAEYEPATRRFTYVNAGHNAPILRRRGGELLHLDVGGLPLGIETGAVYETATLDLEPGDAMIFFTDGVVEAFNSEGVEFGNGRWEETIRALPRTSARESLAFLMTPVDTFVGATRQSDDITCLVFLST
jgi:serine phosphatase RsbU (regulator of sigma subunit)